MALKKKAKPRRHTCYYCGRKKYESAMQVLLKLNATTSVWRCNGTYNKKLNDCI